MGHTYDKLTPLQREKVWELKERKVSGAKIAELLGVGFPREDPPIPKVKITPQAVNSVYRTLKLERDQLYYQRMAAIPTDTLMALNRRKLGQILAAELERLRVAQKRGKLDGDQLRKVAGAAERIEKLEHAAERRGAVPDPPPRKTPQGGDQAEGEKTPSFADSLAADADRHEAEVAEQSKEDADSADPDPPDAVPTDDRAQDTGQSLRATA